MGLQNRMTGDVYRERVDDAGRGGLRVRLLMRADPSLLGLQIASSDQNPTEKAATTFWLNALKIFRCDVIPVN